MSIVPQLLEIPRRHQNTPREAAPYMQPAAGNHCARWLSTPEELSISASLEVNVLHDLPRMTRWLIEGTRLQCLSRLATPLSTSYTALDSLHHSRPAAPLSRGSRGPQGSVPPSPRAPPPQHPSEERKQRSCAASVASDHRGGIPSCGSSYGSAQHREISVKASMKHQNLGAQ